MNDEPSRKAEPVAWMREDGVIAFHSQKEVDSQGFKWIPLYTHPAKCSKCNDTEWVCENHPDQEAHKCIYCEGAGKPCECAYPAKTLTDEEIEELANKYLYVLNDVPYANDIKDFARAILRKAQE